MLRLTVDGMTCDHCVRAVTNAVSALAHVQGVSVDLASGAVVVQGDPDPAVVRKAITDEGYTVRSA